VSKEGFKGKEGNFMIIYINVNGVWKQCITYVNVNGTWQFIFPYIKVGGAW
jgi:hypothetical protein